MSNQKPRPPGAWRRLAGTSIVLTAVSAAPALAQSGSYPLRLSGYGTLGLAHSTETDADFINYYDQPVGVGGTRRVSWDPDTRLALQADVAFSSDLSAAIQGLSRHSYRSGYQPNLEMAFLKWRMTPELSLRVGRIPLQWFAISDYRHAGYAQPWVRPPGELYTSVALYKFDGASLTWLTNAAGASFKTSISAGPMKERVSVDGVFDIRNHVGLNTVGTFGNLTLRANYARVFGVTYSSILADQTFAAIRGGAFPGLPPDNALADEYELANKDATYTSVGAEYDNGSWFAGFEYGRTTKLGTLLGRRMSYLTTGVRLEAWTPYAVVARNKVDKVVPTNNPLMNLFIDQSSRNSATTYSLGLRWDGIKNVAIKAQVDASHPDSDSHGNLVWIMPDYQPGKPYYVTTLVVDFVF